LAVNHATPLPQRKFAIMQIARAVLAALHNTPTPAACSEKLDVAV
jgi:hypothetical protein